MFLTIFYQYGRKATLDAFNIKQSTLYDWKRVISLVPHQTRPLHVRKMETDWRLLAFIKSMRKDQGTIGKDMLKPFVDAYAKEIGIPTIGKTTIGKIIKRRRYTFEKKVYVQKQANKFKKLRTT